MVNRAATKITFLKMLNRKVIKNRNKKIIVQFKDELNHYSRKDLSAASPCLLRTLGSTTWPDLDLRVLLTLRVYH